MKNFIRMIIRKNPTIKRFFQFFLNKFWAMKWSIEKIHLFRYYRKHTNELNDEVKTLLHYIKNRRLSVYNYEWCSDYENVKPDIVYDSDEGRYYVVHNGKRMYMVKGYTQLQIVHMYQSRIREQDRRNPHCYHTFMTKDSYGLVVEGGGAEGMFALDYIEKAKRVVIIEPNSDWISTLRITFREYMDKVVIIDKFLSDHDDGKSITMDKIYQIYGNESEYCVLKMDIEGYEERALMGAYQFLKSPKSIVIACTYHHQSAETDIINMLKPYGFEFQHSNGMMYFPRMYEKQLFPNKKYSDMDSRFRHGVLGAFKDV